MISHVVTRGFGGTIPLVVLRGFVAGPAAEPVEQDSTAPLRHYMALEIPHMLGGTFVLAPELRSLLVAELGETAAVSGTDIDVIAVTPYRGAVMGGSEIEGRVTSFHCMTDDLESAGGALGASVTLRGVTYTIGRIERGDAGLARVELVR